MDKDDLLYVVVSYIPLLRTNQYVIVGSPTSDDVKDLIINHIEKLDNENIDIKGCLWVLSNAQKNDIRLILILPNAKNIVDHLKYWAEDAPDKWFDIRICESDGLYGISLFPRIDKSLDRFKEAIRILQSRYIPDTAIYKIIFRPLNFISKPGSTTFSLMRNNIPQVVLVSAVDVADMPLPGGHKLDVKIPDNIYEIGKLHIKSDYDGYIHNLIKQTNRSH